MELLPTESQHHLISIHKRLHNSQEKPENSEYREVLDPGKLEQLPESRPVGDSEDWVGELQVRGEVPNRVGAVPHHQGLLLVGCHWWGRQKEWHFNRNLTEKNYNGKFYYANTDWHNEKLAEIIIS